MPRKYQDASGQWWHEFTSGRRTRCEERACVTCGATFPDYRGNRHCSPLCASRDINSAEEQAAVVAAYRAGERLRDIRRRLHVSGTTIVKYARAAGLPGRPPGRKVAPDPESLDQRVGRVMEQILLRDARH